MIFQESLRSQESVKMYTYLVMKFMKFHNLKDFDELFGKFEDKYRKLDLFREFILVGYDKQAYQTDNFHIYKNNDRNYSFQFDQV